MSPEPTPEPPTAPTAEPVVGELSARRWVAPVLIGLPLLVGTVVAGLQFGGVLGGTILGVLVLLGLARWERSRRYVVARADEDGVHLRSLADTLAIPWADVDAIAIGHGWLHGSVHITPVGEPTIDLYTMGFRGTSADVRAQIDAFRTVAEAAGTELDLRG